MGKHCSVAFVLIASLRSRAQTQNCSVVTAFDLNAVKVFQPTVFKL